jgi:hypothetical protein
MSGIFLSLFPRCLCSSASQIFFIGRFSFDHASSGMRMFRVLLIRMITTLLFPTPFLSVSWAQDKAGPSTLAPPYPAGAEITSQLNYSCPGNTACSFVCSGGGGLSGTEHVTKLTVYLGTMPLGNNQNAPALFYDFSTRERPNSSGFSISAGLSTLSCQVNGLTLDYVGRPPSRRLPSPQTSQ